MSAMRRPGRVSKATVHFDDLLPVSTTRMPTETTSKHRSASKQQEEEVLIPVFILISDLKEKILVKSTPSPSSREDTSDNKSNTSH